MKLVCPGEAINHCALSANSRRLHLYTSNNSSLISSYFAVKCLISVKTAIKQSSWAPHTVEQPSVRKFGYLVSIQAWFWIWQNRPYICPPIHVSRSKTSHFKWPRVLVVNHMTTRNFREEKQQQSWRKLRRKVKFCFIFLSNRIRKKLYHTKLFPSSLNCNIMST